MPTADLSWALPADLEAKVQSGITSAKEDEIVRRIWAGDPFVWSGADEDRWLGWLNLPVQQRNELAAAERFADRLRREHIPDVVLLGMGGSILAPEVVRVTFGHQKGYPDLHVVDTTDPEQILAVERNIDLNRAVFIVASKSGSTLEPTMLKQYFFHRVAQTVGESEAGRRFVAITDPGSKLHQVAERAGFAEIFQGVPAVGGRYSALSNFGLVPSMVIGVDVRALLDGAEAMARRCSPDEDADRNPGLILGILLGVLATAGHDKATVIISPPMVSFGAWLEQLIAESTGKRGKGIIPIDQESPGDPNVYRNDRVFMYLRLASGTDAVQEARVAGLEAAGHPVIRVAMPGLYALGGEFYRWEFATAVAGAVLRINPFDQPDVEDAKVVAKRLAAEYEKTGTFPEEEPLLSSRGLTLFTDAKGRRTLMEKAGDGRASLASYLRAHVDLLRDGDYFALVAFLAMSESNHRALQAMRHLVRDRKRVATTVGFGPRFLHSTGQAHKGGPNSGVFLQLTCDDAHDLPVPGQKYPFGAIKRAQAIGDFEVLSARGRRLLRVHLGPDVSAGLTTLRAALEEALAS
jgi:transaldolase/glucose-6-phosphate isomerase